MASTDLKKFRKNYTKLTLSKKEVNKNPFLQFNNWFEDALMNENSEVNAMIFATVGENNKPSARVVLLKDFDEKGFVFFTNYESKKGKQISQNNYAAIVFFWHNIERQVRIEGAISKISNDQSDSYFEERPLGNKIGAIVSPQSQVILNSQYLEDLKTKIETKLQNKEIHRPANWGGYCLEPDLFEFWQGRADRLHDRLQYRKEDATWIIERLAP
ncbi:MAG: pyridoxamine 5'-phosphate oxidase [Bacteroidetes bacterium CG2_30_32_10]|nr:MAG: pyridoxamine 5'-phosphate oxidase [Bacteroidetes bacterium CG2_30_32_10]